jgi:hypothetical protein
MMNVVVNIIDTNKYVIKEEKHCFQINFVNLLFQNKMKTRQINCFNRMEIKISIVSLITPSSSLKACFR